MPDSENMHPPKPITGPPSGSILRALLGASIQPGLLSTTLPASLANSSAPPRTASESLGSTIYTSSNSNINAAAAAATTVNITTVNVTYGGDHYGGDIHNGCVGGRRNRNDYSYTQVPPPPCFAIGGTTLACGMAGAFGVAGVAALMLLRR